MKEKFLQFFTGKMGKSVYIAVASAVVCVATVAGSTVSVHNHNQKIDTALESLAQAESITETVTESAAESVSASGEVNTQQSVNVEPAGDKALQYIAEYDKLTAEYQAKRADLVKKMDSVPCNFVTETLREAPKLPQGDNDWGNGGREKYMSDVLQWEEESKIHDTEVSVAVSKAKEEQAYEQSAIQKQIDALDAQYEKDVSELKTRYGMA